MGWDGMGSHIHHHPVTLGERTEGLNGRTGEHGFSWPMHTEY